MQVADKADGMRLCNGTDEIKVHTFINGDTLRPAACHLTDDPPALSSSPQARCLSSTVNDLPGRLQVGEHVASEVLRFQHSRGCIIDRHDIATDDLCIDAGRNGADPSSVGKQFSSKLRAA